MTAFVIALAVVALVSTAVLARKMYRLRRDAIDAGIDVDIINPDDHTDPYLVVGSVAGSWLMVTFTVAVTAVSFLLPVVSSLQGSLNDGWNLFILVFGQLFAWGAYVALRHENFRARSEYDRYHNQQRNWTGL